MKRTESKPLPDGLLDAISYFADKDRALAFMAQVRWPDGKVTCPTCGGREVSFLSTRSLWKCKNNHPKRQFSIKVGTIMEDSPIGLDKWLPAMWMIVNCKNGISSYELARGLRVSQPTAWFMLHRIRLAMQESGGGLLGGPDKPVEVDETWIGGKARGMNIGRRKKSDRGHHHGPYKYSGKAIVLGMLERGGRVRLRHVKDVKKRTLVPKVKEYVAFGSEVHTDAHSAYSGLEHRITAMDADAAKVDVERLGEPMYEHKVVDHAVEYVRGNVHTNGMENFWSLLRAHPTRHDRLDLFRDL